MVGFYEEGRRYGQVSVTGVGGKQVGMVFGAVMRNLHVHDAQFICIPCSACTYRELV